MPLSHPLGLCIVLGILICIYVSTIEVNAWPSCPKFQTYDSYEQDLYHRRAIKVEKWTESYCFTSSDDPDKVVCGKATNITTGSTLAAQCIATCTPGDGVAGIYTLLFSDQEKRFEPGQRLECSPPNSFWPTCPGYEYSSSQRIDGPCRDFNVLSNDTLVCYMITDINTGSFVKAGCTGFCTPGDGVNGSTSLFGNYVEQGEPGQRISCSPLGNASGPPRSSSKDSKDSKDSLPPHPGLAISVAGNLALVLFLFLTAFLMNSEMYSTEANVEAKEKRKTCA